MGDGDNAERAILGLAGGVSRCSHVIKRLFMGSLTVTSAGTSGTCCWPHPGRLRWGISISMRVWMSMLDKVHLGRPIAACRAACRCGIRLCRASGARPSAIVCKYEITVDAITDCQTCSGCRYVPGSTGACFLFLESPWSILRTKCSGYVTRRSREG